MNNYDFKNLLLIKKLEEENKNKTFLRFLIINKYRFLLSIIILFFIFFIYNTFFSKVKINTNNDLLFQINNGETLISISNKLYENKIIKSPIAFKIYIKVFFNNSYIQTGIYSISKKDSLISIANKIMTADFAIPPIKITIPEGSNIYKITNIIADSFNKKENKDLLIDNFDTEIILNKLKDLEGYLFPDTYLFLPNTKINTIISSMTDNFFFSIKNFFEKNNKELGIYSLNMSEFNIDDYFDIKNKEIFLDKRLTIVNSLGTTTTKLKNIIIMASYLEGEANNEEDMRKVAGVLWTRLKLNYPLQIDAATSTYKEKGFTKTPINNPGIIAIRSAINPINTGNIFYITGNNGITYYAKDYKTHLDNINKYLRNNR